MADPQHTRRSSDQGWRNSAFVALKSWRFWMVVWGFALVGAITFTLVTYSRESGDRAAHTAEIRSQQAQCISSRPFLHKINLWVGGVREVGDVLLANSERMHKITPPGSKLYHAQDVNIAKLRQALRPQKHFEIPVPSVAECIARYR